VFYTPVCEKAERCFVRM